MRPPSAYFPLPDQSSAAPSIPAGLPAGAAPAVPPDTPRRPTASIGGDRPDMRQTALLPSLALLLLLAPRAAAQEPQAAPFRFQRGDRVVLVGNTFAERMALH